MRVVHPRAVPREPRLARPRRPTSSSVGVVAHNLRRAVEIGAEGVVVHTGSYVDPAGSAAEHRRRDAPGPRGPAAAARGAWRATTPRGCCSSRPPARAGRCAPASTTSSRYLAALDHHPKAGICLDTCHVFAAGAPLDEPGGATATARPDRRDRRTRPAPADPRQRLDGRARRVQGPAPADRRGPHRRPTRSRELFAHPATDGRAVHPRDARLARRRQPRHPAAQEAARTSA